jgi:hypothetical protein
MQTKQKVILGCTLAVTLVAPMASSFAAVSIAAQDVTVSATTVTGGTGGGLSGYNNSTFTFTPSRSVAMNANGNATDVAVSAASTKGRQSFGGSSTGGSVRQCETTSVSSPTPKAATAGSDGCS